MPILIIEVQSATEEEAELSMSAISVKDWNSSPELRKELLEDYRLNIRYTKVEDEPLDSDIAIGILDNSLEILSDHPIFELADNHKGGMTFEEEGLTYLKVGETNEYIYVETNKHGHIYDPLEELTFETELEAYSFYNLRAIEELNNAIQS